VRQPESPYRYDIDVLRSVAVQTIDLTTLLLVGAKDDHTEIGDRVWATARWLYMNANLNLQAVADLVATHDVELSNALRACDRVEPMIVTSCPRRDGLLDVRMVVPAEVGHKFIDALESAIRRPEKQPPPKARRHSP